MIIDLEENMFFSHGDEARFFHGLEGNPAVKGFRAVAQGKTGRILAVDLDARALNKKVLWDLIALCWRYDVSLKPLRVLAGMKKFSWLRVKHMYWHKDMFGRAARR